MPSSSDAHADRGAVHSRQQPRQDRRASDARHAGPRPLGKQLQEVRELRGKSLNGAAAAAGISAAYLQKLERGEVQTPSPHILHRLAQVLDVPYATLMELAGYVVPRERPHLNEGPPPSALAQAFSSEPLSDDEVHELARYLAWYRHARKAKQEG